MATSIGLLYVHEGPLTASAGVKLFPWRKHVTPNDSRHEWTDVARLISREDFERHYFACFNPLITHAWLDDSGWHEQGRMGWFAVSHTTPVQYTTYANEFMNHVIRAAGPRDLLVLLDCHQ